jgi:phosphate/sulfate permease
MAGANPRAVHRRTLLGIVRGWVTGPPTSFLLALAAALVVRAAGGRLAH